MSRQPTAVLVLLALVLTGCATEDVVDTTAGETGVATTTTEAATTTPGPTGTAVIVDTDVASEGLMSIIYLVGRQDIDIQAITISGTGLVHCTEGVDQVLGILELMEADEIPVACGPERPLEGRNAFPTSWRVVADEGYGLDLDHGRSPSGLSAPDLIAEVIAGSTGPVTIYADGPQTNLAQALRDHPGITEDIEMVYVMGGAIDATGNTIRNPDAEWNIWVDPVAASELFESGVPITLVTLDATNQVPLNVFHREALRSHQETPGAEAVLTMLDNSDQLETGGLYFWDQLTAALLVDESYATMDERRVAVVLDEDRSAAGVTEDSPSGSWMRVASDIDAERFEREFLSAIAGTDVGPIIPDPDWSVTFDGDTWATDLPDSLPAGDYVLRLANESDGDAGIAVGWLTNNATVEDMDAWEGIAQPPWYELEDFLPMAPNTDFVSIASLGSGHEYLLVGLDVANDAATRFALIDVDSSG